jgi:Uma2 family endonuclease
MSHSRENAPAPDGQAGRRGGRPRLHASSAERQKAYRQRLRVKAAAYDALARAAAPELLAAVVANRSAGAPEGPVTDRAPFSMHPEDWVTQADSHDEETYYLKNGLRLLLPDCFVASGLAVYWIPGRTRHPYAGPDIFIARHQPRVEDPKAWLTYEDGPLAFLIEVASDATRRKEARKRDEIYARALQVPEYGYVDLQRGELRLGRLAGGQYEWVEPDAEGRLCSAQFEFGLTWGEKPVGVGGERFVRVVDREGAIVPAPREAAARAEREAQRAEALAAEVERLRRLLAARGNCGDGSGQ